MRNNKRLFIAFLFSILLHSLIFMVIYPLNLPKNSPKKINLENLLVLKRGQSQDISKDKEGGRKPSLASQNAIKQALPQPKQITKNSPQRPNQEKKPLPKDENQTQKQEDSQKKSLDTYDPNSFDPRNLSFLNQSQQIGSQSYQTQLYSKENDRGRDPQTIQDINTLYGEEFGDLGTAQKDFIRNNLRNIGRITQRYLKYPQVAAYFEQSGINAVEFYLHPNGDITDLKIIKSSGLNSFDSNTLNTIRLAYKDYPRPTEKTLIRIRVTYSYWGF